MIIKFLKSLYRGSAAPPRNDHLQELYGAQLPLYLMKNGELGFAPLQGASQHRYFINSIPKAGTYFLQGMLTELSCVPTDIHFMNDFFTDYRNLSDKEFISVTKDRHWNMDIHNSLALIRKGQFGVGHINRTKETDGIFDDFRIILVVREIRSTLVSLMRFYTKNGRHSTTDESWVQIEDDKARFLEFLKRKGEYQIQRGNLIFDWKNNANVLTIKYEELMGDYGKEPQQGCASNITRFADADLSTDELSDKLQSVIDNPNKTWSGKRSNVSEFWSKDAEKIFVEQGGEELNQKIGYDD